MKEDEGFADIILIVAVISCLSIGGYFALKTKHIDHPVEQASELFLKTQGIDVDFSAEKKKEEKDND